MSQREPKVPPKRTEKHDALDVFLGDWRAEGWSFGQPDQPADAPKAAREKWTSTHTGKWHTGKFFLIQDEHALIGANDPPPFDTISIMGVDPETQEYFARSFENHGFFRLYEGQKDGNSWKFVGATERVSIEFSDGAQRQTVTWEWLKDGKWHPLCDRIATRSS